MDELQTSSVPVVSHLVRRRRYGSEAWLIHKNDWYALDDITDSIWICCEQSMPIVEIIERVSTDANIPLNEAVAATTFTVLRFHHLRLIDLQTEPLI